ncbi:O-acyltransferase like protein-like isoform X1 [Synchiropus splendidus]|uniref:O-acyltransferase like protein-like isoform X1 n=1 Tax=Synchiropus splendidus TaxID=270530 RepID=UPI00237E5487|nr:O-acyltransferase like protein-like isoform X1 [Synchiropus splendidus]
MAAGYVLLLLIVTCSALEKCKNDTDVFLQELSQDKPKDFAVVMYDSFGKMGSGVVGGNVNQPGSLHECLSVQTASFSGQYCQVFISQGRAVHFVGICVPDSCSKTQVHMMVLQGKLKFHNTPLIPPLPPLLVNNSLRRVLWTTCLPRTVTPDASGIACLVLCCVIVALPLAATLVTAVKIWRRSRQVPPTEEPSALSMVQNGDLNSFSYSDMNAHRLKENDQGNKSQQRFLSRCLQQFLQAFSLQTTTKGVLSTSTSVKGTYLSLNGIRALSMLWIISGHNVQLTTVSIDNINNLQASLETNPLHIFTMKGGLYLAVDTFLLLGGLLSAKSLLSSIQRNGDTMSPRLVADYFFKRLRRVQPLHMFAMLLFIAVTSFFNGGPYWEKAKTSGLECHQYWWTNVLLINNLFGQDLHCLPWTWYLSLDFQCFATTPLLILAHRKNKVVFAILVVALLLMTILTNSFVTAFSRNWDSFSYLLYNKPYSRYGSFLVGVLFGMFLKEKKEKILKKKWQVALGWIASLSIMALVVGVNYALPYGPGQSSVPHAIYGGLHRTVWATAVTWVILACEEGYGGYIMSLLSLKFWVPFSNLSYACYLIHPFIIFIYIGLQETPIHYLDINFMYLFLGHTALTIVLSYVMTVLVERPFILLKWK